MPEVIKRRIQDYKEKTPRILQLFRETMAPFVVAHCDALDTPPEKVVDSIMKDLAKLNL